MEGKNMRQSKARSRQMISCVSSLLLGTFLCIVSIGCGGKSSSTNVTTDSPQLTSWQTKLSGRYARVVEQTGGTEVTTWPSAGLNKMGGGQSQPAYSDITQVSYSSRYTYIKGTGLASHQMGPWYNGVNVIFGNWPANQNYIRRFPRTPQAATAKTTNGLGALGVWVNGVALYNLLDGFSYSTTTGREATGAGGNGIWMRNAQFVESPTFDKSNAHQPGNGEYHYHSSPNALRAQLGDNIQGDSNTGYSESMSAPTHSPILGWAYDGYPIYGPYGYSNTSGGGGIRRMVSGFVIRDGNNGTTNLATTGRNTLAKWSATLHGLSQTLTAAQYGPDISTNFALGRYVEDFDYLGDLGKTQGTDFDLDLYNGRFCVTPEYPNGTYAYFVTVDAAGQPAFPYVIGRQYYGIVSGGSVTVISESVTVYKDAGPATAITLATASSAGAKTLTWVSVEGGNYKVEGSNDGAAWAVVSSSVTSGGISTTLTLAAGSASATFSQYRVILSSLDAYDSTGNTTAGV
jgi:YHYH protein